MENICKYFNQYHSEKRCKCVDDLTDCNGDEKKCEYPKGKKSYEED